MQRVAVTDDLPVLDPGAAHFFLECPDMFRRRQRIVCAGADQHAGRQLAAHRRHLVGEHAVKADDGRKIGAVARKLEGHRAAEAETDRAQPACIDLRQRGERHQRGTRTRAQGLRIVAKAADQMGRFLQTVRLPAVAEHVGGERDIAKFRQLARPRDRKVAQSQPLVKHQHARPRVPGGFVEGEMPPQRDCLAAVIDVLIMHCENRRVSKQLEPELPTAARRAQGRIRNIAKSEKRRRHHICLNPA